MSLKVHTQYMQAAEKISCYLKKKNKRLLYTKQDSDHIEGFSDPNYVGIVDDRRSTTGYCLFL